MRKILAFLIALSTLLALAGCADNMDNTPTAPASAPSSTTPIPTGAYPDFEPTPVNYTVEEILERAISYIQDKKPDKSKHAQDRVDAVEYNWFADTVLPASKADRDLFDVLGYGGEYMSVDITRRDYEYQDKVAYDITLSYTVPCSDTAQLLAYAKDDLHRFAAFRTLAQRKISYVIIQEGASRRKETERLTDEDYQQLLTSDKIYIRTNDNSKKSGQVRFKVKAIDGNYCIDITIST